MSEKLKSCPFCGSDDMSVVSEWYIFVACRNPSCAADGPIKKSRTEAIAAWNTRAGEKA